MLDTKWRDVFRSFFSEANVNFNTTPTQYITGRNVDDPSVTIARSGAQLATEITQLLVDIRAADAEDLNKWVEQNPGDAPPEDIAGMSAMGRRPQELLRSPILFIYMNGCICIAPLTT